MRANTDRAPGVRLITDYPATGRAEREAARKEEIDALLESAKPSEPGDIVCLLSRMTAGLGVQALWIPETGETAITVTLGAETETFDVAPEHLLDAFHHPYVYGASLDC